jgi:hypothetical protein
MTHNVATNFTQCPWKFHIAVTGLMLFHNTTLGFYNAIYQAPDNCQS